MKRIFGLTSIAALAIAACSGGIEDQNAESTGELSASLTSNFAGVRTSGSTATSSAAGNPTYGGGQLATHPAVVVVFWNSSVNSTLKNNMPSFYQTMTNNAYLDTVNEYGVSTQTMGRGSLNATVTITPGHTSSSLTDADIQAELFAQVQAGKLPTPTDVIYQIHFPPGVTIQGPAGGAPGQSCVAWCAYHWTTTVPFAIGGLSVAYSVIPDMGTGSGCSCGSGTLLENTTSVSSHELLEATTDPFPFTGWVPEIADPCQSVPRATIFSASGSSYKVQPIWSNAVSGCVSLPPATVGVFRPNTGQDEWLLRSTNTHGNPDFDFLFGGTGDQPVVGDWNGSNERTIGIYRPSTNQWYLRNSNTAGNADITVFAYGGSGDIPIVGDWDGNGTTTVGVFRPAGSPLNQTTQAMWLLRNSNAGGNPDIQFAYGAAGDIPVVGDWTGIGKTTIGVYRPSSNQWFLRNSNTAGSADIPVFAYGSTGDVPVVGSWTGNGLTTVGVYRPAQGPLNSSLEAQWLLRSSNTGGNPDLVLGYGGVGDRPVVGPWRRH